MSVKGTDQVMKRFQFLITDCPEEVKQALKIEAELMMTDCKKETPVDTGRLRESGFVEEPVNVNGDITVTLGFGGAAKSYATYVHENLEATHIVGNAKFLENPVKRRLPNLVQRISSRVLRMAKRG